MSAQDTPRAFPSVAIEDAHGGMELRDWFAGQALVMLPHMGCGADLDTHDTALAAYQFADAMMEARKRCG